MGLVFFSLFFIRLLESNPASPPLVTLFSFVVSVFAIIVSEGSLVVHYLYSDSTHITIGVTLTTTQITLTLELT